MTSVGETVGTKKQRNKFRDARQNAPAPVGHTDPAGQLEAAWQAAAKSESAFVQKSLENFVEAAAYLLDLVRAGPDKSPTQDELADALKDYGKRARLVDLIAVISAAAWKKYGRQSIDINQARRLIDGAMAVYLKTDDRGMASLTHPAWSGPAVATRSDQGRWLARQISRIGGKAVESENIQSVDQLFQAAQSSEKEGRTEDAIRHYKAILAVDPKNIRALSALGVLYAEDPLLRDEAIAFCRAALKLDSNSIALRVNLGNALWNHVNMTPRQNQERDEAIRCYEQALLVQPDNIQVLTNLASAYMGCDKCEEAESIYARVLKLDPHFPAALTGMGMIASLRFNYEEAAQFFIKASRIDPRYVEALVNLAFIRLHQGRIEEAGALYDKAMQTKPKVPELWRYKAFYLLATGHYRQGWDLYEKERARDIGHQVENPFPAKPAWDGKPDPNLRLLIWREQGYGDSLQFIRYVAACKKYVGQVFVYCPKSLVSLFKNCPYVDDAFCSAFSFKFDAQVALLSLPSLLTSINEPVAEIPYLFISEQKKRYARGLLASGQNSGLKVGLVWAGNPRKKEVGNYRIDRRRSMHLQTMLPLFDVQGVVFYNLQKDEPAAQIDACGLRGRMIDLMPQCDSYEETGAIIENLDLVIAVDTSVAHLAGGLGKPVWVLSRYDPCWRWMLNRPDSPWYPTARVFGQKKPGDWDSVILEVRAALENLASQAGLRQEPRLQKVAT